MVSSMDDSIGWIVEKMKRFVYTKDGSEKTLFDDTIFIFSSDNGGMSQGLGYAGTSNKPLRGWKGGTWEGGCHVPAFITNLYITGTHEDMFHMTDWLPTIYSGILGANQSVNCVIWCRRLFDSADLPNPAVVGWSGMSVRNTSSCFLKMSTLWLPMFLTSVGS